MEKLVRGVALVALGAFVVGAGYGIVQQMVKISTLQSLNNNDISIDEAFRGVVTRPPSPIPDVPPAPTLPQ